MHWWPEHSRYNPLRYAAVNTLAPDQTRCVGLKSRPSMCFPTPSEKRADVADYS